MPVIIILTIIAIVGIGFGGFEFYQNSSKTSEVNDLKSQLVANTNDNKSDGDILSIPSVENAEKLLESYTGDGLKTGTYLNAFYDIFTSNFDDKQKVFLAYSQIKDNQKNTVVCASEWYEKGACTKKSISYDLINAKYQLLFGNSVSLKKVNYAFHDFFYMVYNAATGAYDEYILPGGGTGPIVAMHKVVSTKSATGGFIATVSFMEMNLDIELKNSYSAGTTLSGGLGISDKTVDDAIDSMAVYEFKFAKNGDSYVLAGIIKLGDS